MTMVNINYSKMLLAKSPKKQIMEAILIVIITQWVALENLTDNLWKTLIN